MKKFLIYGLYDPESGELRYIGQTRQSLKARLYQHISEANNRRCLNNHNHSWINLLSEKGLKPIIKELQELNNQEDLNGAEIYWIKYFREQECRLTNSSEGGEGSRNPSEHTRQLLRESKSGKKNPMFGKKQSPELIEKRIRRGELNNWFGLIGPLNPKFGIPRTKEVIAKIAKGNTGKVRNEESKRRQSETRSKRFAEGLYEAYYHKPPRTREQLEKQVRSMGGKPFVCINNGKTYISQHEAAKELKVLQSGISGVLRGRANHTRGYKFKYVEDLSNGK